jgi:hypothetical protein
METRVDPKSRFADDTSAHRMTVLLDQGLYRHLRFADPASNFSWFEIITVPGLLTINGDMGTFTFSREKDMFPLFRRADGGINAHYWAEKIVASSDPAKAYSAKVFAETIRQDAEGQLDAADIEGDQRTAALAELQDDVLSVADEGEHEAFRALSDFRHELLDFTDAWDHVFTEYNFRYLWNLHAIVHGITEYTAHAGAMAELAAA